MPTTAPIEAGTRYALFAGLCASFVGIGLARFAYTPLIPALIGAQWLTPAAAAYLGAANFAGYLCGAWLSQAIGHAIGPRAALRGAILLTAVSFAACAWPWHEAWLFAWRFIAGATGGVLMVLAAPAILSRLPAARRGLASGVIFTGIGLGVAAAGSLLPLLLPSGLRVVWLGFAGVTLLLGALSWQGWPAAAMAPAQTVRPPRETRHALRALYAVYGLNAFALVPHMVFFVDFIARGLRQGVSTGAAYWVIFGIAACCGPMLGGLLADRIGFRRALRTTYALQLVAVLLPLVETGTAALALSAIIAGASVPGVVALTLGRSQELVTDDDARRAAWRACTITFAVAQAIGAYVLSFVFARSESFAALFAMGAAALLVALLLDIAVRRGESRRAPQS